MTTLDQTALVAGLMTHSGRMQQHAYVRNHAKDITTDFITVLLSTAVTQLEVEDSSLRAVARDLTVLAVASAILMGNDGEKGRAQFFKGHVLIGLSDPINAIASLRDAAVYLARAKDHKLLATCYLRHAGLLRGLGRPREAMACLGQALAEQADTEERAHTVRAMQTLAVESGDLLDAEGLTDTIRRWANPPSIDGLRARRVDDPAEKLHIAESLGAAHPSLADPALRSLSVLGFIADPRYEFFTLENSADSVGSSPSLAYALAFPYEDRFHNRILVGLEAFLSAVEGPELLIQSMQSLLQMARDMGGAALCVGPATLGSVDVFKSFVRRLGGAPMTSALMTGPRPGVYSAFSEPSDPVHYRAPCVHIRATAETHDFTGARHSTSLLYRGEGRLRHRSERASWNCNDLHDLALYFFEEGFRARAEGVFDGTIQSQLRHQGYVDQPTVSLSAEAAVCAYYATDKHARDAGGLVFEIRPLVVHLPGPIYDSLATFKRACPWVFETFFKLMEKIRHALDDSSDDVTQSGAFLQRLHEMSWQRWAGASGNDLDTTVDWPGVLGIALYSRLIGGGVSYEDLQLVMEDFKIHWLVATEQLVGSDDIHEDGHIEHTRLSRAYFRAFDDVALELKERWILNRYSPYNHAGWDTSPFGYITKTLRDQEFFTSGDLPGSCIVRASVVDRYGRALRAIDNPRATLRPRGSSVR